MPTRDTLSSGGRACAIRPSASSAVTATSIPTRGDQEPPRWFDQHNPTSMSRLARSPPGYRLRDHGAASVKVISSITTSVDGYITGPNDGPGRGLGDGGERLHYWVFGGPWSYDTHPLGKPNGTDAEFFDRMVSNLGAVVGGRGTFYAADGWGGHNP